MRLLKKLILFIFIPVSYCSAQDSASAAGSHFKISGSRSFWMGYNYRREWNTPVKAPVINLATEYGGLTPVKRGGGKQTKSLRVKDASGREYTFRSIQKFITSKTMPIDLQSEAAEDLVNDGVSASYPYGALSVTVLAEAAGIPYNKVRLVYIPDDPRLGEFQKDFGNMLAFLEEKIPANVKKDYDSDEVMEKLKDDNDNETDQLALLKIRILDMFVMDLDRHEGQWVWGAIEKDKGKIYFPIAKDRDQAFYTNQGFLPGIAAWPWLVPQLEGFKADARNIRRFNFAARNFDRFFLNQLTEAEWKKTTEDFLSKMTDDVIERALAQQPKEIYAFSAPKIAQTLKDRRKYLLDDVMQYYKFLAETVSITGSDKKEQFVATRENNGSVLLQVFKINKEGEVSSKMFERLFDANDTREIRLYGFDGDDKFIVNGSEDKIKIRMIGGKGEDMFDHTGAGGGGIVYDSTGEKNTVTGKFSEKLKNDTLVNSYDFTGFKYNTVIPFLSVNYNSDDGLYLGLSIKVIRQGFRKTPYKNMHQFVINHALGTQGWNFRYYSEYISVFSKKSDLLFDADIKSPNNTSNFFGYGVGTFYDKTKPGKFKYYRARYNLGDISLLLRQNFSPKVVMTLGPTYEFYSMDSSDNKNRNIVTVIPGLDPNSRFKKQSYFGFRFGFDVDTRNNAVLPEKGIMWQNRLRYLSGTSNTPYEVTQLNSDLNFYVTLIKKTLIFADRVGGGHNFGSYEFYNAQFLGMEDNLRGYRKYRFSGRSKLYNQAELRLRLANFKTYLFPGSLGILAFVDAGTVWTDNYNYDNWVNGYGAGFWFSPLRRMVITFTYAASKEDKTPLIGLGWKF
jgi:hypothetical protein